MQKQKSHNFPKFIITMTIILLFGTLFVAVGYYLMKDNKTEIQQINLEKLSDDKISNNYEDNKIENEIDISDWKTYRSEEFGFEIILFESWKGYKVFKKSWNGTTLDGNSVKYEGPKIVIRNPKWSEDKIWQDISVLVFTKDEWQLIEENNLNIFAAPIAPEKLGENNEYIFALPPRWIGFTDALGQDEAQKTVETFKALALDKTFNWKTYNNSETNFTFKYPKDWETSEDYFYETASGIKSERRTVILNKVGENESNGRISINQRQFICNQGKCEMIAGNEIGTYSRNPETLIIFEQIISTFKIIEKERQLYFGLNQNDEYSLVDLNSGKIRKFIPDEYELVGYQIVAYPDYVILKKNNEIYSYFLKDEKINKIGLEKLEHNEEIIQKPSISEKEKFYIIKNTLDLEEEWGMGGPNVIKSERYLFDAEKNLIERIENFDIDISSCNCTEYDSKYQRIFFWPCCEGIGNSIPLLVYDMKSKKKKELISFKDFGLTEDSMGLISLKYNNGNFLAISKIPENFTKIIIVDTKENPEKNIYEISENIKSKIENIYAYSVLFVGDKKTIVIGGGHFILLLHFDENKIIKDSTYFSEPGAYANFIFTDEENLYYKVKDTIKIINFDNRRIEKNINDQKGRSITIFSY